MLIGVEPPLVNESICHLPAAQISSYRGIQAEMG
jgi:hypothetical protein